MQSCDLGCEIGPSNVSADQSSIVSSGTVSISGRKSPKLTEKLCTLNKIKLFQILIFELTGKSPKTRIAEFAINVDLSRLKEQSHLNLQCCPLVFNFSTSNNLQ